MATRSVDILINGRDRSKQAFRSASASISGLAKAALAAGAAVGAYLGARQLVRAIRASTDAFIQQEQAVLKLSNALTLVGGGGTRAVKDMEVFAAQIQKTTMLGDEAVLEMASLGASLGNLSGKALQNATKAAIGLSEKLGIDTTAAMRLVARAAVGDTAQLKRYGIVIAETLNPQERFNELLKIGAGAFALAEGRADSLGGRLQQLKNAWGDLLETIGEVFAPTLQASFEFLRDLINDISAGVKGMAIGFTRATLTLSHLVDLITGGGPSKFTERLNELLDKLIKGPGPGTPGKPRPPAGDTDTGGPRGAAATTLASRFRVGLIERVGGEAPLVQISNHTKQTNTILDGLKRAIDEGNRLTERLVDAAGERIILGGALR